MFWWDAAAEIAVYPCSARPPSARRAPLATWSRVELSKRGILYSYTTVRVPPAGWPGPVPYVLGQVELPEGPQVLAELVDCPESDLKIGLAVELTLRPVQPAEGDTKIVVYKWRPAPDPLESKETQECQREQN